MLLLLLVMWSCGLEVIRQLVTLNRRRDGRGTRPTPPLLPPPPSAAPPPAPQERPPNVSTGTINSSPHREPLTNKQLAVNMRSIYPSF